MNRCLCLNVLAALSVLSVPVLSQAQVWSGYAQNPQHTATSTVAAQPLNNIHWRTSIDATQNPPGSGALYVHYGSPVITAANTVIVPETTASGGFQLQAFNGATGASLYTLSTTYTLPPHIWTPSYAPALALGRRLFYAGPGGTIYYRDTPDSATGPSGQFAFYGISSYNANPSAYNGVQISTPLTADRLGNIYFGFVVTGSNPLNLVSGLAKVSYTGVGSWVSATALTGDSSANQIAQNSAPALSNLQTTLYVATSNGAEYGYGYLVSLNTSNLAPLSHVELFDPQTGNSATVSSDSTASPMVGPDGDVYFGVLESPCCSSHNDRGWLLHFNSTLSALKTPGSFGWDDTASVVPAISVPSYAGTSSYLLLTKYNDYIGLGTGTGQNKVAILDPNATQADEYADPFYTPVTVMQEVITVTGPTPNGPAPSVREWCINTAAIDPITKAALINSEDGNLYRWDFTTNTLLQTMTLTSGRGEAYTPTLIGSDGTVYAINDASLFAVGN